MYTSLFALFFVAVSLSVVFFGVVVRFLGVVLFFGVVVCQVFFTFVLHRSSFYGKMT